LVSNAREATLGLTNFKAPFAYGSTGSVLLGALVVPNLPLDPLIRNALGLITIFGPFAFLIGTSLFPSVLQQLGKKPSSNSRSRDREIEADRIAFHEAGHFLACYLGGIPVSGYNVDTIDGRGATTEVVANIPTLIALQSQIKPKTANKASKASAGGTQSTVTRTIEQQAELSASAALLASQTGNLLYCSMAGMVAETLRCGEWVMRTNSVGM
jgi:hypothetical protein